MEKMIENSKSLKELRKAVQEIIDKNPAESAWWAHQLEQKLNTKLYKRKWERQTPKKTTSPKNYEKTYRVSYVGDRTNTGT